MNGKTNENQRILTNAAPTALHRRIAENLTGQVTNGQLKPGQKLPSERYIAHQFGASRATVRTALQHLEQSGLITRRDRRSAVIAIRRDITPHLRIACSSGRIVNIFRRLSEMQILPPRCQLQLLDLQQSGVIGQILTQPVCGADILICEQEYVRCLRNQPDLFYPLSKNVPAEAELKETLLKSFAENGQYIAIPLSASPMLLYYNKAVFRDHKMRMPYGAWQWDQLMQFAQRFAGEGIYGFQFRPTFSHMADLMSHRGCELYQNDGRIAVASPVFEDTLRFIHNLLYVNKISPVSPVRTKADQINLFAQRRCAMAVDGFDMFGHYHQTLGDDLAVTVLPGETIGGSITSGLVALVMAVPENLQPIEDLLRTLLSTSTQQTLAQIGAGLPTRNGMLNHDSLETMNFPARIVDTFLSQAGNFQYANQPSSLDYKTAAENLFLELWLRLDKLDSICQRFRQL